MVIILEWNIFSTTDVIVKILQYQPLDKKYNECDLINVNNFENISARYVNYLKSRFFMFTFTDRFTKAAQVL